MFTILKLFIFASFIYSSASMSTSDQSPIYATDECEEFLKADINFSIPLNKTPEYGHNKIYDRLITLNRTQVAQINFSNINPVISFVIIQIHLYKHRVTLHKNIIARNATISGSHLGMYSDVRKSRDLFFVHNCNKEIDVVFDFSVHGYYPQDPIPGGCNLESPIPIAPFLVMKSQTHSHAIDAAPPMAPADPECISQRSNEVVVEFYMIYLPEHDFTPESFYLGVRKMMTLIRIKSYAVKIPKTAWKMRRLMSAYAGVGAVFGAIATTPEGYSVYVPTLTYSCLNNYLLCSWRDNTSTIASSIILAFVSAYLCFMGSRYFMLEIMVIGIVDSAILVVALSPSYESDYLAMVGALIAGGVFFIFWIVLWMVNGLPVTAVLLPSLNLGAMVASVILYRLPDDFALLHSNFNFWTLFVLVMLLVTLGVVSMPYHGNLLCSSILGSYGIIISIDLCLNSAMKFIVGNTIRRATVQNFNNAVLFLPFTTNEKILSAVWAVLATSGMALQYFTNRRRPNFPLPPNCNGCTAALCRVCFETAVSRDNPGPANENTPLLTHAI